MQMATNKQREQTKDSEKKNTSLDRRYGKIGIPAVAGAVQPKREPQRNAVEPRHHIVHESD
jgi:hypothetical protein